MRRETRQYMLAVLPDTLRHNQRRIRIHRPKHLHPALLRVNEAVLLLAVVDVGAYRRPARSLERLGQRRLHFRLLRPANLVCRQP